MDTAQLLKAINDLPARSLVDINTLHASLVAVVKALEGRTFAGDARRDPVTVNTLHYGLMLIDNLHPANQGGTTNDQLVINNARQILEARLKQLHNPTSLYAKFYARLGAPA